MINEILVPFNGSEQTRRAVEIAAGLARSANCQLRMLAYSDDPETAINSAALHECTAEIRERYHISPQTTTVPSFRFLSDELLTQSARRPGSVICIPSLGLGRRALLTGSLATDVLTYNPGPTVLVGPHCEAHMFDHDGPMLVALDGSTESESILEVAHEWAQRFNLPVEVAAVLDAVPSPVAAAAIASGDIQESSYLAGVTHDSPIHDDDPTFEVLHGKPAKALLDEAKARNASLIAMSSHVPLGIDRLLHGSVLDSIARHSEIPVLALGQQPARRTT